MKANEYQEACMRTASGVSTANEENMLLQGVMGMCGEAGEAIDIVKKIIFQGHPLDEEAKKHLAIELGDVMWYVATTVRSLGIDLETIMEMNVQKLSRRYPDGFEVEKSTCRKEGDL